MFSRKLFSSRTLTCALLFFQPPKTAYFVCFTPFVAARVVVGCGVARMPKPKLLCLHGRRSNAEVTEMQCQGILELDKVAVLGDDVLVTAPADANANHDESLGD